MEALDTKQLLVVKRDGSCVPSEERMLKEHQIDIYVNEQLVMKVTCTASRLEELVLGRLLTEGYFTDYSQVQKLYICEEGYRAKVFLDRDITDFVKERTLMVATCCTDNRSLEVEAERLIRGKLPAVEIMPEWIFALADAFVEDTDLHRTTTGTHSCRLMHRGEILVSCEDIGRHNALDKAIGWAMREGVDLSECILHTSGRMPMDMVRKAIRAKAMALVGKGIPTADGIELAKEYGLTLIGAARPDRYKMFSDSSAETIRE